MHELSIIRQILNFAVIPFIRKNEVNQIKGSALQLAIISSLILAGGAHFMTNSAERSIKTSRSFIATNAKRTVGVKVYNAALSISSIIKSSELSPAISKACLLDFEKCVNSKGKFPLYTESGEMLTGEYNRLGQNCTILKSSSRSCSKSDLIFEVGEIEFEVSGSPKKLFFKYLTKNLTSGKPIYDNYLSMDKYEFSGLGKAKLCADEFGKKRYVSKVGNGEVVCSRPLAFVGPSGIDGTNGANGEMGIAGPRGPNGPQGPRGNRGAIYHIRNGGCFAPGTLIMTYKNGYKKVEDIAQGDELLNPATKTKTTVSRVVRGEETLPMIKITSNNYQVEVTAEHPLIVKNLHHGFEKIVKASEIKEGDYLKTVNGFEFVESISMEVKEKGYQVYNIDLEASELFVDHLIDAAGIVSGDLFIQKILNEKQEMSLYDFKSTNNSH